MPSYKKIISETKALLEEQRKIVSAVVVLRRLEDIYPEFVNVHNLPSESKVLLEEQRKIDSAVMMPKKLEVTFTNFDVSDDYKPDESIVPPILNDDVPSNEVSSLPESPIPPTSSDPIPSLPESPIPSTSSAPIPSLPESPIPSTFSAPIPSLEESPIPSTSNAPAQRRRFKYVYKSMPPSITCTVCKIFETIHKKSLYRHYIQIHNLEWSRVRDRHIDSKFYVKKQCWFCHKYLINISRHLLTCKTKAKHDERKAPSKKFLQVEEYNTYIPLEKIMDKVKDWFTDTYSKPTVDCYFSTLKTFLAFCEKEDSTYKTSRMFDSCEAITFIPLSLMDIFLRGKTANSGVNLCKAVLAFISYMNYVSQLLADSKLIRNELRYRLFVADVKEKVPKMLKHLRKRADKERQHVNWLHQWTSCRYHQGNGKAPEIPNL